jgi:hypothetical protein
MRLGLNLFKEGIHCRMFLNNWLAAVISNHLMF